MSDTTTPRNFAATLSDMVGSALMRAASDRGALVAAAEAFKAGDIDQARLVILNATAPTMGGNRDSIQDAVRVSLPNTTGDRVSGM